MTNKYILIFGASRGIGKALTLKFAEDENNRVIALSRNEKAMETAFNRPNIDYYYFDLEDGERKAKLMAVLKRYPHLDIVINNAGKLVNKPFLELTREDIRTSYETNIMGVIETTQIVVQKMIQKGGHIVNISTIGGFQGSVKFPGLTAYSTSKAAVTSFTELFAEEYKDTKIVMNCLCLGATQTEMLEEAFPDYQAPVSAEEMAGFIFDFANNAHRFMKGKIIPVSLSTP